MQLKSSRRSGGSAVRFDQLHGGHAVKIAIYLDNRYIEIYIENMKHRHRGGRDHPRSDDVREHHRGAHDHDRHHGRRGYRLSGRQGERGGRPFDYGELRLLVLAMIAEEPRHGYQLMRAIEERMGGSYSPSPGVMYPTLSWLEDMGYARVEVDGGRKSYAISEEGKAFLTANRAAIDEVQSRIGADRTNGRHKRVPAPVIRGMENLKLALRLRMRRGLVDETAAKQIAAALDAAAQSIERS